MGDSIRAALEQLVELDGLPDSWSPAGIQAWDDAIAAGKAALAEQQGEGPTLEEVEELLNRFAAFNIECLQGLINDALARWGHQPTPPPELLADLISGSKPLDPEMAEVLTPEARWGLYGGSPEKPPIQGEVVAISNAIDAMKLALRSHGVFSASDPPQDAWKFRGVSMRLSDAIRQLEKLKESINE